MGHSEVFHSPYQEHDNELLQMDCNEAIEVIMDQYGDEIKRLIYTYLKNSADTDDVTQEVFVTVFQKLSTFQGRSSLRSWIYSIAINKSKDYLRSWQYRNKRLVDRVMKATSMNEKKYNNTPETQLVNQSESSNLLNQVMELPIKYREVVILYYLKEWSTKEISHTLNLNEATVRTRLNRGRNKLKQLLTKERGVNHG